MYARFSILCTLAMALSATAGAQVWKSARWERGLKDRYDARIDVVYSRTDTIDSKLDVYIPRDAQGPRPVLIWIHGGGWGRLSKDSVSGQLIPFLERNWVVVNVDYRLTPQAPAPAAVIDCRCALRWVLEWAEELKADPERIVVSGSSAGGHLALMTGMLPPDSPMDTKCAGPSARPAAIVNFYGITDVADLLGTANRRGYAVQWLGEGPDRESLALSVSPLTYVRTDMPPVFTIHGDADPTVPYTHAVRLHRALDDAGVPNRLYTVPGGLHGKFSKEQAASILDAVAEFLRERGIIADEDLPRGSKQ
jgi:acetyl esterase/lipase